MRTTGNYIHMHIFFKRPRCTQFGYLLANIFTPLPCIAFFMITLQCLAYLKKHILATIAIHLYPFQQKPTFPSSHDTDWSGHCGFKHVFIISDHVRRCTWKPCDRLQNHRFILILAKVIQVREVSYLFLIPVFLFFGISGSRSQWEWP